MRKPSQERCKKYMLWIRAQPCMICFRSGDNDPHHWQKKGDGGMGTKCSDLRCVPMCHEHHHEIHQNGKLSFMRNHQISDESLELVILYLHRKYFGEENVTDKKV